MKSMIDRVARFFRDVRSELRKVVWPDRRQTLLLTSVVVSTTLVVAGVVWLFDLMMSSAMGFLLSK